MSIDKAIKNVKRRKKVLLAALFLLTFFLLLLWTYSRGLSNPIKTPETREIPPVLENAFLRWFRGENGELLATFRLQNYTDKFIGRVEINCVAYYANDEEAGNYNQKISVSLMPSEVRMLNRAYMGVLDPLAQKVNCALERWE
ncbi:MAG: hypothetical protein LBP89_06710 [Helicobacteraceae bacterium]|jgi:hypothetical protein|nr:hypothetical protein [Helicobacteraceae bacterium]